MTDQSYRTVFKSDYHFKTGDHKEIRKEIEFCRDLTINASKAVAVCMRVFSRLTDLGKYQCQARFDMYGRDTDLFSMRETYRFFDQQHCFLAVQHFVNRPFALDEEAVALKGSLWDALSASRGRNIAKGEIDWDALSRLDRAALHKAHFVAELAEGILKCSPQAKPKLFKTASSTVVVFENICGTSFTIVIKLTDD